MNTSQNVISLTNVTVVNNQKMILSDVNVSISSGEFVYVVGKSGAGKSSLLKLLYGEQKANQGTSIVQETDLQRLNWRTLPKFRRKMGIISNEYPLLFHLNVYQNLEIVLRAISKNRQKDVLMNKIMEVLNLVSLSDKLHAMPFELSTGEKQRIQVARGLLNSVKLIIADEPTANLDPETSFEITDLMHSICKKFDITFVISTNDYAIIRHYPSRILHIRDNKLSDYASLESIQI